MIEWLMGGRHRIMLTFSTSEANRLQRLNPQVKDQIMFWQDYLHNKRRAMPPHQIGIDQADFLLDGLLGQQVDRATFNLAEDDI